MSETVPEISADSPQSHTKHRLWRFFEAGSRKLSKQESTALSPEAITEFTEPRTVDRELIFCDM